MTPADFKVGQRVRVIERIELYPLGIYEVGTEGTVTAADPYCEMNPICAEIRLDGEHPELDEWEGNLHVHDDDWSCCTSDCWEIIDPA